MNKYYSILYHINKLGYLTQRALAKACSMSVGNINASLKELVREEYLIEKDKVYGLTEKGRRFLEDSLENKQIEKLKLDSGEKGTPVKTAVILAAGINLCFTKPIGLLTIDGLPVIELIMRNLSLHGIENYYIVAGYQKDEYRNYFKNRRNVHLVVNDRYKWTGTMASLGTVKEFIKEDFLLVDANQIFEETAISKLLECPDRNCVLLTNPSDSNDEAYVELNPDNTIFRISKDIKQMNHIDAELVGVSKISYPLFEKMLEYFKDNQNPLLNYEYVLENIGRIYQITGVMADDMAWTVIENDQLYRKAEKLVYPRIKKRERLRKENHARETLKVCMSVKDDDIEECSIGGGMTNTNFFVKVQGKRYILRMPGAGTDVMIDRKSEQHNAALASALGINPPTVYCNVETGIKITECIPQAETLNGKTARLEMNMKKTTAILRELHESHMKMYGTFSVKEEYEKYKKQIHEANGVYYDGFEAVDRFFYELLERLEKLGTVLKPCHNDLVAENFIKDKNGKMYLIDWEYAGYNDPMWDLAAHLAECEFKPLEEELFLEHYFQKQPDEISKEKIAIFKICQDVLWSAWTILKETRGEDFGSYGIDRMKRAIQKKEQYVLTY